MKKPGFFKALLRGGLKTFPGVSAVVELIKNVKAERQNSNLTQGQAPIEIPHNYWSIGIQLLGIFAIIYAFITHLITIDDLLRLIGFSNGAGSVQ